MLVVSSTLAVEPPGIPAKYGSALADTVTLVLWLVPINAATDVTVRSQVGRPITVPHVSETALLFALVRETVTCTAV